MPLRPPLAPERRPLLVRHVEPPNAFAVTRLPLLSRLEREAFRHRRRIGRRFVNRPLRRLFRWLYRLGMSGRGEFALNLPGRSIRLPFEARNLQFGALYRTEYAGRYEWETLAVIARALGSSGTFFDIGANWGYFSFFVASLPGYSGRIVAFEPFPQSFAELAGLVREAGLEARIDCRDVALSAASGTGDMAMPDGMRSGIARLGARGGVSVRMARLDDLELPPPAVLKLDVEGHEGSVLEGAQRILERDRPLVVFESWRDVRNPGAVLQPFEVLEPLGYQFFEPAWLAEHGGKKVAIWGEPRGAGPHDLALVPFEAEQRLLLDGFQFNVVACHRERVAALAEALATPRPSTDSMATNRHAGGGQG